MTDRLAWAKPGTKAVIQSITRYGAGGAASHEIVVVARVTPSQVVTSDGRRYRKSDGKQLGGNTTLGRISLLVNLRFNRAEWLIRRAIEEARQGSGHRAALAEIAEIVAAAIADIDALEAPATEVTS